jgi:hypothetical protein
MFQNCHDGLGICRDHGPPDFFVTFTCNLGWPKIVDSFFGPGQIAPDRSDVIVKVFHLKLDDLLDDIRSITIFGPLVVGTTLYTLNLFLSFFP